MADEIKPIGVDSTGYELLTDAVKDLLNQFPGLLEGETVKFESLESESGIIFSNDAGALIYTESEDIVGGVHQSCQYPFLIVYRASESEREHQKMHIATFLDLFGKWLCKEPVVIEGTEYKLKSWPKLSNGRKIKRITRSNLYGSAPLSNGVQDWVLPMTIYYTNDFER